MFCSILIYLHVCVLKLVKWFIAPLFGEEQWPTSNSHALPLYPNNCVYQRGRIHFLLFTPLLLFLGEKLHNPLQESCPSRPFLWSGPDPSGALAGCNTALVGSEPLIRVSVCPGFVAVREGACALGSRGICHPQKEKTSTGTKYRWTWHHQKQHGM